MSLPVRTFLAVACSIGTALALTGRSAAEEKLSFNRDVRPILSDTCFFCHGPDPAHREAGLRLDVEESAKEWAIMPGDVEASELVARITSDDPYMVMPPADSGKSLSDEQIETLTRWVAEGAEYEAYWAYVPPTEHAAPDVDEIAQDAGVDDAAWSRDPIDRFTLAEMTEQGFAPNPPADPATLIRRVTFDLTGMPPTPEQVAKFVADPNPAAYRRVVDRLLASPAFGERMAIYWLDLVRYADTVGYHGDQDHNISPYRDYVIDAFNRNLPLSRFTREQLAGDLLPNPTVDQKVATGYNRVLQTSHEGGVQPKEYLSIYFADRVRNVSEVWMGATVGCAQCHDHKYDPYTAEDFYSLGAFFADIDEAKHFEVGGNSLPTNRPPEIGVLSRWQRERLAAIEQQLDALKAAPEGSADARRREELATEKRRIAQSKRETMVTRAIEPREIRVLPRGNWMDDSGPVVQPAVPGFMPQLETGDRRATRLDLANWLTDTEAGVGGLTARVFANRFWYLMFGRGLSPSLADFGGQGQPPTHPKLLDQLAVDFVESGWDVKAMLRRLVLTQTYQQSSVATPEEIRRDPENRYLARQSRHRLPAEMVRDNALAVSGLLIRRVGGKSVKPYQPPGYYRHLNFPKRSYVPDQDSGKWRRGVYVHWQRQFLHPMLKSLDAPSREECTAQRSRSNTPLEALVLLNDPSMLETAIFFAQRMRTGEADGQRAKIRDGFLRATSRRPDTVELDALENLLESQRTYYESNPQKAAKLVETAGRFEQTPPNEQIEWAAWTSVARAMLNLYETVTRN